MSAVLGQWRKILPDVGPGRKLRLVPDRPARFSQLGFAIFFISMLALVMVGVLVINTQIQSQSAQLSRLEREARELSYIEASLTSQAHQLSSVNNLANQAKQLGMVPNPHPAFIYLDTGQVVGDVSGVSGDEMPEVISSIEPVETMGLAKPGPDTNKTSSNQPAITIPEDPNAQPVPGIGLPTAPSEVAR